MLLLQEMAPLALPKVGNSMERDSFTTSWALVGERVIPETSISQKASFPLPSVLLAVMVTLPGLWGVTVPSLATVATFSSLLVHSSVWLLALLGVMPTSSLWLFRISITREVGFMKRPVIGISAAATVTVQASVFVGSLVLAAMISAVPAPTAVTTPLSSTVATFSLLLRQVTSWPSLPSVIITVAARGLDTSPAIIFMREGVTTISRTSMCWLP